MTLDQAGRWQGSGRGWESGMIQAYYSAVRRFNRDIRLYLVATALLGFAVFSGIYPVLFNLYLLRLGYGTEFVGWANSVVMLTFAFCSPVAGMVSQIKIGGRPLGGRRTMVAGLSIVIAGYALLSVVEYMPRGLWSAWLMASGFVRAVGFALYWVNARPFLMSATSEGERYHVYSVQAAITPLAGVLGSLVAGILPGLFAGWIGVSLDHPAPYRYPLWIAAALLVPTFLATVAMRDFDDGQAGEHTSRIRGVPLGLIGRLALVILLQAAGQGAVYSYFNVYLDAELRVSTSAIGTISALGWLLAGIGALCTPALVARWGDNRALFWGSVGISASLLPLALIRHWGAAGLGYLGVVVLFSILMPAMNVFQMELVEPRWRATMSGATAMASGLSSSIVTLAGGYVITSLGYRTLFLAAAGVTIAGAALFWAYFRQPQGAEVTAVVTKT
ncbi:MAG TPA: MFS transporter [Anaerolineae bacterium]|nr:MFS transporter [Anaerolineae bacterium]